ncbi:hypothetical protein B0H14DRAFT_3634444 [Mycena olivaceomarginata]|nr:hypothetical protein B0H14DRAFT_3634444 [Mycena olivaceomarginata]
MGKLKADNWLVLFTIFFPLIIPELWFHDSSSKLERKLLDNFHNLIGATNIVCSYTAIPAEADEYVKMYIDYLRSSQTLFPGLSTRPNHHYAMHNGEQMKWWGPLMKLNEFMYESHNGSLQKIKTNNHMWEMDLTMLRQMCRRGRLLASISDTVQTTDPESLVGKAMRILSPRVPVSADSVNPTQLSPAQETAHNGSGVVLDGSTYELILRYWNQAHSPPYVRATDLTYDLLDAGVGVFPTRAVPLTNFLHKTRLFSTFKNTMAVAPFLSVIPRRDGRAWDSLNPYGRRPYRDRRGHSLSSGPTLALSLADAAKTPYPTHPRFACVVGYTEPLQPQPQLIVEPRHIISHVAYYSRPKGTYGVQQAITIFADSLHRGRD